jgi:hypothetical protein
MGIKFISPAGRLNFPNVTEKKAYREGQKEKYSLELLIPKEPTGVKSDMLCSIGGKMQIMTLSDWLKALKDERDEMIDAAYPKKRPDDSAFLKSIHDGDTWKYSIKEKKGELKKDTYPQYAGCYIIAASNYNIAPNICDASGAPIQDSRNVEVTKETTLKKVRSGFWARISFDQFMYSNDNLGFMCGLKNIQMLREDEVFSGGKTSSANDDFSGAFEEAAMENNKADNFL